MLLIYNQFRSIDMAVKWHTTKYPGVRYREHNTRKNGVGFDRCYSIRYKIDGKDKEEAVGWGTEGMTAERAAKVLGELKENIRLGAGPQSLREKRERNQEKARLEKEQAQRRQLQAKTFSEFWEESYWPEAEHSKKNNSTRTELGLYKVWLQPEIGGIPLHELEAKRLQAVVNKAKIAGRSSRTLQYMMAVVSQVWALAVRDKIVQGEAPTRGVNLPKINNKRTEFLTPEQASQLLAALKTRSPDMHDEALLSMSSGLRSGEIHALCWGDVDAANGILLIRDAKNGEDRRAPMTAHVRQMLESRYTGQAKNELIFPATNGKQRQLVSATFRKVINDLGFNDGVTDSKQRICFHSLRHTAASWATQEGSSPYEVKELLGHKSLAMVTRYAHLAPDAMKKVVCRLEDKLGEVYKAEGGPSEDNSQDKGY
jgi:integrase